MNNPLQDDLLGYVLGALDAQEQRDLQQRIDQNPELEEQLLQIRSSLLPLDFIESVESCPGLARRTCESVAIWQNADSVGRLKASENHLNQPTVDDGTVAELVGSDGANLNSLSEPSHLAAPQVDEPVDGRHGAFGSDRMLHPSTWSISDMLVGIVLLGIIAGIAFPAIAYTRANSRIAACQEHLQILGVALATYSSINDGDFVSIPLTGPMSVTGSFASTLKDSGLLASDSLLGCPGLGDDRPQVFIPSRSQVLAARDEFELDHFHRTMSGDYAYTMGYMVDGAYRAPRNQGRASIVLIADQPSVDLENRESRNHNGWGQNCLFGDLSVALVSGHSIGTDALFVNDYGVVAPGVSFRDNVIAPSHLSPWQAFEMFRGSAFATE